jgi:hypothetical protein
MASDTCPPPPGSGNGSPEPDHYMPRWLSHKYSRQMSK